MVQLRGNADKDANLAGIERLTTEAAQSGAAIVCLPELCTTTYFCVERDPKHRDLAEPISGPSVARAAALAKRLEIVLVFPFYERDGDRLFNTAAVLGPDGGLIGTYRKSSLSQMRASEAFGQITTTEAFYFDPGDSGFPVFDTPFGVRIGVLICNDRHFPEAARVLALQGAHLILVPTCSARAWMHAIWEVELRAHAVMNGVFVGGVNKVGTDIGGLADRPNFGSSLFVNPFGEVTAMASADTEEWIQGQIDVELIAQHRDDWGVFNNRRPEHYGLLTVPNGSVSVSPTR
jgi:N-carbamoylputrescine amidase